MRPVRLVPAPRPHTQLNRRMKGGTETESCPRPWAAPRPRWSAVQLLFFSPPLRQHRGTSMVYSVNFHANVNRNGSHVWEIDLRFAPGLPPGVGLTSFLKPRKKRKRDGFHFSSPSVTARLAWLPGRHGRQMYGGTACTSGKTKHGCEIPAESCAFWFRDVLVTDSEM